MSESVSNLQIRWRPPWWHLSKDLLLHPCPSSPSLLKLNSLKRFWHMKAKRFNPSTANSLRQRPSSHYIAPGSPDLWQGFVAPAEKKTKVEGSLRTVIQLLFNYHNELKFHREVTIVSHYRERFTFKERKEESWSPEKAVFFTLSASTWVQVSDIFQQQNKETRCWYTEALKEIKKLIKTKGLTTERGSRAEENKSKAWYKLQKSWQEERGLSRERNGPLSQSESQRSHVLERACMISTLPWATHKEETLLQWNRFINYYSWICVFLVLTKTMIIFFKAHYRSASFFPALVCLQGANHETWGWRPEDKYFYLSLGSLSLVPVLREARLEDPIMSGKKTNGQKSLNWRNTKKTLRKALAQSTQTK